MEFGFNLIASDLSVSSVHKVWLHDEPCGVGKKEACYGTHSLAPEYMGQGRYLNTTHSHRTLNHVLHNDLTSQVLRCISKYFSAQS